MSREEHLHIRGKVPPFNPSSILLDGLQLYLCSKLLENGAKFIQKLTPGFKNHTRNLDNLCLDNLWNMDKQWKVHEVEIQWATLSKKYIPSSKNIGIYNQYRGSNIAFNYCENSPGSFALCHF